MNANTPADRAQAHSDVTRGVVSWFVKGLFAKVVLAAILFLAVGRLDWANGWVLVGLYLFFDTATLLVLLPRNPALLAERSRIQPGTKKWDVVLAGLAASLLPMITWLVAGLDAQFGWSSPVPLAVQVGAVAVFCLAWALLIWSMAANSFFSTMVRIQQDRGHQVATGGPYRYVRHPGYVGAIAFGLATPLILGSLWALVPAGLSAVLYVVRTALEDQTLRAELDGYEEYAQQVRYRLLPGIW